MSRQLVPILIATLAICWFLWRGFWDLAAINGVLVVFFVVALLIERSTKKQ
jgi:hypothetical protein